ncbi:MAG: AAA-like domain-containing protein [Lachnospiraceae bacterium]|nr:AAA-like domain-containing protein [Lachnospiraceae bacterium]
MKCFNTTGLCIPAKHYMVDISERLAEIRKLVDGGKYFVINRGRQYGKTTTLYALEQFLKDDYYVISLDFQELENDSFENGRVFTQALAQIILDKLEMDEASETDVPEEIWEELQGLVDRDVQKVKMLDIFRLFKRWCKESAKPVVLMIDEVDSATNNQVFLDFLAQLRLHYLEREKSERFKTFHSVILAGVTDVRHLKSKIRDEDQRKVNSPWNIATPFKVDMSFSADGIMGMLEEYEGDHHTGMDVAQMARLIYAQTSGYPFLVSRLCQLIDEEVCGENGYYAGKWSEGWTRNGLDEALKLILSEKNTLFESLAGKLVNNENLKASIRGLLMEGERLPYNVMSESIQQMEMYGFIKNEHNVVVIANRIFETILYNLFFTEEDLEGDAFAKAGDLDRNIFVTNGKLNMRLVLQHFVDTYLKVFGPLEDKFKEKDGRELFLLYLRPIINGTGNYYIEAQTRDQTRTDVVVDYRGQQYVVELKIWRGQRYNEAGEKQLQEYLDYFGLDVGYMLSFNFNKTKETGVKQVHVGEKLLFEATV